MGRQRFGSVLGMLALLSACGGGEGGGAPGGSGSVNNPPPAGTAGCSLRERQDWAASVLDEWYLYPETLPANLSPAGYASVQDYIDALTATARGQRRDRYWTFVTSIKEENAYYSSGANSGYGFRLAYDEAAGRVLVIEAFENTPALQAGIDRGTEILAIGASAGSLRAVSDIIATEGTGGVSAALGPPTAGISRTLRIADPAGAVRDVTLARAEYSILPLSSRYGARIIEDGGRRVGYVNLRTFISPAEPALRDAFAQFQASGVSDVIVDMRYNGGGLIATAELFGDLLGGGQGGAVFSHTTFRASKASNNRTRAFQPQPQSISPMRIAFIGRGGTASASELLINGMLPSYGNRAALIGTNTYGKPVGQVALDQTACDDRLRVVAISTQNSLGQGYYYDGMLDRVGTSCQAPDDILYQLGDPQEASTRAALDFIAGRSCTPITGTAARQQAVTERELLSPDRPTIAQREMPGLF